MAATTRSRTWLAGSFAEAAACRRFAVPLIGRRHGRGARQAAELNVATQSKSWGVLPSSAGSGDVRSGTRRIGRREAAAAIR